MDNNQKKVTLENILILALSVLVAILFMQLHELRQAFDNRSDKLNTAFEEMINVVEESDSRSDEALDLAEEAFYRTDELCSYYNCDF